MGFYEAMSAFHPHRTDCNRPIADISKLHDAGLGIKAGRRPIMTSSEVYSSMESLLGAWTLMGHIDEREDRLFEVDWQDGHAVDLEINQSVVSEFARMSPPEQSRVREALRFTLQNDDAYIAKMMNYFEIYFECPSFRAVLERIQFNIGES